PLHTFLFPLPFSLQNPRPPRISTLSLHDALPIFCRAPPATGGCGLVVLPTGRTEELMPTLTALLPALRHDPGLAELVEAVPARGALDIAASVGVRPAVLAGLAPRGHRPLGVVAAPGRQAAR